jgi:hypothetical protein
MPTYKIKEHGYKWRYVPENPGDAFLARGFAGNVL